MSERGKKKCLGCVGGCTGCLAAHPEGKTCNDCVHIERCTWLLSYTGAETSCDWIPSRFRDKATLLPPTDPKP